MVLYERENLTTKELIMPAVVENMMFVGETPWHGLGNQVDAGIAINDLKDLQTVDGVPVNHRATYRKSDGSILGVVGPRYTPLQNRDAFDWFQPFIDANECSIHTAGALSKGLGSCSVEP